MTYRCRRAATAASRLRCSPRQFVLHDGTSPRGRGLHERELAIAPLNAPYLPGPDEVGVQRKLDVVVDLAVAQTSTTGVVKEGVEGGAALLDRRLSNVLVRHTGPPCYGDGDRHPSRGVVDQLPLRVRSVWVRVLAPSEKEMRQLSSSQAPMKSSRFGIVCSRRVVDT